LREGKGGGGRATSGPVRKRWAEGALRSSDGQTGSDGAVIERRKTTAWWAFVGRVAEKPPGLVQGFWAGRAQWAEMGQKAGRTGRYGGLHDEKSKERLTGGLPRIPGRTDFGPRGRIEKQSFQILIQGMRFKSKF
jgi:hypothetical protein